METEGREKTALQNPYKTPKTDYSARNPIKQWARDETVRTQQSWDGPQTLAHSGSYRSRHQHPKTQPCAFGVTQRGEDLWLVNVGI